MISASILTPIYSVFSYILQIMYQYLNDYGVSIIIFTFALRALIIPLGIKQHKTTLKMQALAPQVDDLKRAFGKDKQGLQMATMELYKKNNVSQLGGCLPSIIPLLLLIPVYRIVSAPMQYILGVSEANIKSVADYLQGLNLISESQIKNLSISDIPVINALNTNPETFTHAVNNQWLQAKDYFSLDFLGINLGDVPTYRPALLFGSEMGRYLPLLILVLIAVITTFLTSKVMEMTNPAYKNIKESKERAKLNPARSEVSDMSQQGMMKGMKYTMPLVTLYMCMTLPAAMSLYWCIGNVMAIVQQILLYFLYTRHNTKNKPVEPAK